MRLFETRKAQMFTSWNAKEECDVSFYSSIPLSPCWNAWWLLWPNNAFSGRTCVPYKLLVVRGVPFQSPPCNFQRGWLFTPFQRDGSPNVCCIFVVLTAIAVLERAFGRGLGNGGRNPLPVTQNLQMYRILFSYFAVCMCLRLEVT